MAKKEKYYRRPDGLFETIRVINGKRKAFRGRTCREVDRKILEYREEVKKGRLFSEVADEWERKHETEIGESARIGYHYPVMRLKEAFPGRIREIEPVDIQNYIKRFEAKGYSKGSVGKEISVCKMIFAHAVVQGDIRLNPAVEIKKSRGLPYKEREALTEDQEATVKAAGVARNAHWWLFGYFLLYTGCRRGEALAVTYKDIDRKAGVIHITKKVNYATGKPVLENHLKSKNGKRDIPLLAPLAAAIPQNRIGLVFPGSDGSYMRSHEIARDWKQYCRDIGFHQIVLDDNEKPKEIFPITPHCFRHSFATICYEAGLDARQAASFLGDTPKVVETIYTHLRKEKQQTAAEKLAAYIDLEMAE